MLRPPSFPLFPYTTLFRSEEMASTGLSRVGMKKLRVLDLLADDTGRENLKCPFELSYFYGEGFNLRDGRRKNIIFIPGGDRKSTRLNSSHMSISYAVFCLK